MDFADINIIVTNKTGLSTSEFSNADRAIYMNVYNNIVVSTIYLSQDDSDYDDPNHGDLPIVTTPLVADQRHYSIPQSEQVMGIKRIDITYDGENYYKATMIDSSGFYSGLGDDTTTDGRFAQASPAVDLQYSTWALYPRTSQVDVDAGAQARIEWSRSPKQITATILSTGTAIPGYDETFQPLLAYGCAYEKAQELGLSNRDELKEMVNQLLAMLEKQYGKKNMGGDMHLMSNAGLINRNYHGQGSYSRFGSS